MSDEELMERINTVVSAETERLNKMGSRKSPQVSHVDAQTTDTGQGATSKDKPASKEAKPNKLVAALEAVQSDLASLREEFRKSQATAKECGPQEQPSRRMNLCHVMHVKMRGNSDVAIVTSVDQRNILLVGARRIGIRETPRGYGRGTGCSSGCSVVPRLSIMWKERGTV